MERTNDLFIHEIENWTSFRWNAACLSELSAPTNKAIGYLSVSSSEIEGIILNTAEVRSSVARKLGVAVPDTKEPTHCIDGFPYI